MAIKLSKDYAEIKAGVSGLVGDPPESVDLPEAPEAPAAPAPPVSSVEAEGPETNYLSPEPAPNQPPVYNVESYAPSGVDVEKIHEISEAIVNERWEEFLSRVGDLAVWKEKTDTNIISIKQEIVRINEKFENLQNAVLGKIRESDQGMRDVHTEIKALEKVFEKIIEPLVTNIKELGKITEELKRLR